jgi:hypothetical protein
MRHKYDPAHIAWSNALDYGVECELGLALDAQEHYIFISRPYGTKSGLMCP